jgi:hypothetical protein
MGGVVWCCKKKCVPRGAFVGSGETRQSRRVVPSWDNPESLWRVGWRVRWSPIFGVTRQIGVSGPGLASPLEML